MKTQHPQSTTTQLPVRCAGFFFAASLAWTIVLGTIGAALGTEKVDSPGSEWIGVALLLHIPAICVCAMLFPTLPMPAGDEGGFEVILLCLSILPSSCFYTLVGWVFGHIIAAARQKPSGEGQGGLGERFVP